MRPSLNLFLLVLFTASLAACSTLENLGGESDYPEQTREGTLDGSSILDNFNRTSERGFSLGFGRGNNNDAAPNLGVNAALWQATLDSLAFLPLASADPQGGVIITDWYEDPNAAAATRTRFKVNALIIGQDLRSDNLRVSVFREKYADGGWRTTATSGTLARQLENIILTRARDLRLRKNSER